MYPLVAPTSCKVNTTDLKFLLYLLYEISVVLHHEQWDQMTTMVPIQYLAIYLAKNNCPIDKAVYKRNIADLRQQKNAFYLQWRQNFQNSWINCNIANCKDYVATASKVHIIIGTAPISPLTFPHCWVLPNLSK